MVLSVLLAAALYWRVVSRARSAIRSWADEFGYRVVSARFETAFSDRYREAGRTAEFVYRVELSSASGDRATGRALIWNVLHGPVTVVVRWDPGPF
jgi:hypothetical protein